MSQIGSNHHMAKISESDVINIRELFSIRRQLIKQANQLTIKKIAEKFTIKESACRDVIYRQTWKHVIDDFDYDVK